MIVTKINVATKIVNLFIIYNQRVIYANMRILATIINYMDVRQVVSIELQNKLVKLSFIIGRTSLRLKQE